MPKVSYKRKYSEAILNYHIFEILWTDNSEGMDHELERCFRDLVLLNSTRYWVSRISQVPKSKVWVLNVLPNYDDKRFKSTLRVSRSDFKLILDIIASNSVFNDPKRRGRVEPVELQLAIALYRFGFDGSGASHCNVGQKFGVLSLSPNLNFTKPNLT